VVLLFLGVLRVIHDYVVYPRIIGQGIHLHPLAVILAILAGAEIAGVAGIFLAIPVIAILTVSYRHWLEHRGSETIAEVLEEAVVESEIDQLASTHPTALTTAEEMARARPDLLTGELKPPDMHHHMHHQMHHPPPDLDPGLPDSDSGLQDCDPQLQDCDKPI